MTIKEALNSAQEKLNKKKIASARLDAEVLLAFCLKIEREYLLAHDEKKLTPAEQKKYTGLIKRRLAYEPIAYLIGTKNFYGLDFKVDYRVLIPRPETEQLVTIVSEYAHKLASKGLKMAILDVGTGSGCICLTLKKLLPKMSIIGLEVSGEALSLARLNAKKLDLDVVFLKSDLLTGFEKDLSNFILVANLPYLDRNEIKDFPIDIKRGLSYEPSQALYAGHHGLNAYRHLFKQITKYKTQPQALFIEIGSAYWRDFLKLSKQYFPQADISVIDDLTKRKRFIKIIF